MFVHRLLRAWKSVRFISLDGLEASKEEVDEDSMAVRQTAYR